MYTLHPVFTPPNPHDKLWRFMDFTKFVSLLESSSLYFARSDKFDDPFEGRSPRYNIETMAERYKPAKPEFIDTWRRIDEKHREYNFINCWHKNDYESAAMWDLYCRTKDEGIAIQTTFDKLCNSFNSYKEEVYIGKVKYIDYEKDWIDEDNGFHRYLHKRKSFEHEQEVRAIIFQWPKEGETGERTEDGFPIYDMNAPVKIEGISVPISLTTLFHKIYVSPKSKTWFVHLVSSILKRYNISIEPIKSDLYNGPLY